MRQKFATTVRFFLQALDESAADAVAAIDRLAELHEKMRLSWTRWEGRKKCLARLSLYRGESDRRYTKDGRGMGDVLPYGWGGNPAAGRMRNLGRNKREEKKPHLCL